MVRSALITVDNYPNVAGAHLSGCVNDGRHMEHVLVEEGFDDVSMLIDAEDTKANIEKELDRLVDGLGPDDLGLWFRSSHGTQGAAGSDPAEPDRRMEGIVPNDFRTAGIIWDDQLRATLGRVHPRARMVVIFDTCFSGGMFRAAAQVGDAYRRVRYLPPEVWLRPEDIQAAVDAADPGLREVLNPGHRADLARQFVLDRTAAVAGQRAPKQYPVLLLSACREDQVAMCADINDVPQGAFTWALLEALESEPRSYREWMYGSRDRHGVTSLRPDQPALLPSVDFAQQPVLHGTPGRVRWPVLQA